MPKSLSAQAETAISHPLIRILLSVVLPVTAFGLLLITEGKTRVATYGVILNAVFGSRYGFGEVIVKATLLILTSLTAILPYRVGMANAGGEGQMAIGALTAAVAGTTFFTSGSRSHRYPPYASERYDRRRHLGRNCRPFQNETAA